MGLINFNDAIKLIKNADIKVIDTELIPLNKCVNRVLAKDILAIEDMPKFDTSSMDGYAFCYDDLNYLINNGLEITDINKAGSKIEYTIKKRGCIKTFTGSKIPNNADTIILVEQVEIKDNKIFLLKNEKIKKGDWIRKKAQNYSNNDILLSKGHLISPFDIGVLAQNNYVFVEVFKKPRISIFSSGDEIIEIGQTRDNENTIYSSNSHTINALLNSLGAKASIHRILKDNKEEIKFSINKALHYSDMIIIIGGMSKGDFDFNKNIIKELGNIIFNGVNIKPGKVIMYVNNKGYKHILGLPGNPVSSVVSFLLFGRLILQKMLRRNINIPIHKAILLNAININSNKTEFITAKITIQNGSYQAEPIFSESYMINSLKDGLIIADKNNIKTGTFVDIILLNDLRKL